MSIATRRSRTKNFLCLDCQTRWENRKITRAMNRPTWSRNLGDCVGKRSASELYQIHWKTRTALMMLATRIYYRRDLAPHKFLPRPPPPPPSQRRGPKNWRAPQYLESRWSAIVVIINDTTYSVRNAIWPCSQVLLFYCVCSLIRLCAWYLGLCLVFVAWYLSYLYASFSIIHKTKKMCAHFSVFAHWLYNNIGKR